MMFHAIEREALTASLRERGQTAVSRQRLEEFIKINKAQLWIQHDMVGYRKIKLAPEYKDQARA